MQHLVNKQYKYNNDDFPGEKEVLNSVCSVTDCSLVMVNLSLKASGLQILIHMSLCAQTKNLYVALC